jgi:hypothetical protein
MTLADFVKVPVGVSLLVIAVLLGGSVVASLVSTRRAERPKIRA